MVIILHDNNNNSMIIVHINLQYLGKIPAKALEVKLEKLGIAILARFSINID